MKVARDLRSVAIFFDFYDMDYLVILPEIRFESRSVFSQALNIKWYKYINSVFAAKVYIIHLKKMHHDKNLFVEDGA